MSKKNRRELYDDEDEISQSIRQFQQGAQQTEEAESEDTTGFGINSPEYKSEEDTIPPELPVEVGSFVCSCCGGAWSFDRGRMGRPGCSCPIYKTCKGCDHCQKHCECKPVAS